MPKVVVYVPAAAWRRLEERGLDPAATVREFARSGYEMTGFASGIALQQMPRFEDGIPTPELIFPPLLRSDVDHHALDELRLSGHILNDERFIAQPHDCAVPANHPVFAGERLKRGNGMIELAKDPVAVFRKGTPQSAGEATKALLEATRGFKNFYISSGCDLMPGTPLATLNAFFRAVVEFNK